MLIHYLLRAGTKAKQIEPNCCVIERVKLGYLLMTDDSEEPTLEEKIAQIAYRFYEPQNTGILGSLSSPFDITKPNIHDSKSEFELEKTSVLEAIASAENIRNLILLCVEKDDEPSKAMANRVRKFVDDNALKQSSRNSSESVVDFIRQSACREGLSGNVLLIMDKYLSYLKELLEILEQQEIEFWSNNHRPPNHFARIIALRFARLIAKKTGKKPTFGTSREGQHPSTDFGRALEEIFELLEVNSDVKRAARWAISELKAEDCTDATVRVPGSLPSLGIFAQNSNALSNLLIQNSIKKGN